MSLDQVLVPNTFKDGDIVVVPTTKLHELLGGPFNGLKPISSYELFKFLQANMCFLPRGEETEKNRNFKQVIPYFLVRLDDRFLTARRSSGSTDRRLHNRRLIGFGGHLGAKDITGPIETWLETEYYEEIKGCEIVQIIPHGLINHDGDEDGGINWVHVAMVFEIIVTGNPRIAEPDNFEDEDLLTLDGLMPYRDEMEMWSRHLFDHLYTRSA